MKFPFISISMKTIHFQIKILEGKALLILEFLIGKKPTQWLNEDEIGLGGTWKGSEGENRDWKGKIQVEKGKVWCHPGTSLCLFTGGNWGTIFPGIPTENPRESVGW